MNGDPLYEAIAKGLARRLDPHLFQLCAEALLQEAYPSLALMRGGDDAGMDGAIGSSQGAFPLVATTSPRLSENLRKNLKTYRDQTDGPALAIFATSQDVTPPMRRKLTAEATKLGVRLVNVHDRLDFTQRLYRDSIWRLRLLGITGTPPALSKIPRTRRLGFSSRPLVGREADRDWLRGQAGDLLLMGQPGLGKTFLHQQLANEGRCLFLVDDDQTRIADAIRSQDPGAIVVDDAHTRIGMLDLLVHLRQTIGSKFAIHANCWPRSEGEVRAHLQVASAQIRRLRPLDRDTMVTLLKESDIAGPRALVSLLLDYSEGKPGLAVALADLVKRSDFDRVWRGDAVLDELIEGPQLARTRRERAVLAAFAVGGDFGQTIADVARALEIPPIEVSDVVTTLAAGGVIEESGTTRFQVRPEVLRGVLVKDVFFSGANSLAIDPLLSSSPAPDDTAHILMAAHQRDGSVPLDLIEARVRSSTNGGVWEHFAFLGEQTAALILEKYPNRVAAAGRGLLEHFPEETLAALLEGDSGATTRTGDLKNRRELIGSWVMGDASRGRVTVERRGHLLAVVEKGVRTSPPLANETLGWALGEVIAPGFQRNEAVPGSGREFTFSSGIWSRGELEEIAALWPRVRSLLAQLPISAWGPVRQEIENWAHPARLLHLKTPGPSLRRFMRATAKRMLSDVAALPNSTLLLKSWVIDKALWAGFRVSVKVDSAVRLLYGSEPPRGDSHKRDGALDGAIQKLALRLARQQPADVLDDLKGHDDLFREVNGGHGSRQWRLYAALGRVVRNPEDWLNAAFEKGASEDAVRPFAWRLLESDRSKAEEWLAKLLSVPAYQRTAVDYVLRLPGASRELLDEALRQFSPSAYDAFGLGLLRLAPDVMDRLLRHADRSTRVLAALAEWWSEPKGEVRAPLRDAWREAILDAETDDNFHLGAVLRADPGLAFDWIEQKLTTFERLYVIRDVIVDAASVLPTDSRAALIRRLRDNYDDEVFDAICRGDVDVFDAWLGEPIEEHLKLQPLSRRVSDSWIQMAIRALDRGVSEAAIARYAQPRVLSVVGNWSALFEEMVSDYERLLKHPDRRLHRAGREGLAWAKRRRNEALGDEERESIKGL